MKQMNQTNDFFTRLLSVQHRMPRKMAQLAAFVSDNYVRVAFMTTREVAAAAGVSLSTVVRFPVLLGYADYDEFRSSIQERVNHDLRGISRLHTLPSADGSALHLLQRTVAADMDAMQAMLHSFDEEAFEQFVYEIVGAPSVLLVGFRSTAPLVAYSGLALRKLRAGVTYFTYADSQIYDHLHLCDHNDVLLVIGFAPYLADLLAFARHAHQHGVRIISITDSHLSPLTALSQITLLVRPGTLDFAGSLAAVGALLHAVVVQVALHLGSNAQERLQRLTDAAVDAGLYDRAGNRLPIRSEHLLNDDWPPDAPSEEHAGPWNETYLASE